MTGLLSGVVVVLIICHTPKTFINIQVRCVKRLIWSYYNNILLVITINQYSSVNIST